MAQGLRMNNGIQRTFPYRIIRRRDDPTSIGLGRSRRAPTAIPIPAQEHSFIKPPMQHSWEARSTCANSWTVSSARQKR